MEGIEMPNSVYKIIELVGSSSTSWEEATNNAVNYQVINDQASRFFPGS